MVKTGAINGTGSKSSISSAQFFVAMFVSRAVLTIALNARYSGGENLLRCIPSYLAAMALGLIIAVPIWLCHREDPGRSVPEKAAALGPLGRAAPLCYLIYFVVVGGSSLGVFQIFLMDTVNPGFSAGLVTAALVGVALYGAARGLETVARCGTCVFAALILGCGLVFAMVAGRFRLANLEPMGESLDLWRGAALFISRSSLFADMAVLLPRVKGRKKLGFGMCLLGGGAFVSLLVVLIAGCLGRYAYTQNFPVYVLASITEVRSMQRLDAVFTGLWMMGLIVKLSFDLCACRLCFMDLLGREGKVGREKEPGWALPLAGGLMLTLALLMVNLAAVQSFLLDPAVLSIGAAAVGGLLPLVVYIACKLKKGGRKYGQNG